MASFRATGAGRLEYRVVAVARDGKRAEAPPVAITVSAPPTTATKTSPTTKPTNNPPPAPNSANLHIEAATNEGDAETETVTFKTDNLGLANVTGEQVLVKALGGGEIQAASYRFGESGPARACTLHDAGATCEIGEHVSKHGGFVVVQVTVKWAPESTGLRATVKDTGGTKDLDLSNNKATWSRLPIATDTVTQTPTDPGITDTTTSTSPPTG